MRLNQALSNALVRFLTQEVRNYQRRIPNDLDRLKKHIRPGDVVLVEGKSRISQIIKYLTQSSWSHSCIYIGDRLIAENHPLGARYRERYGEEACHLVVEADLASGVEALPLVRYAEYNLRVCRPYSISGEDLDKVLEEVISRIGEGYDRKHILDLGRYLTPFHLLPGRLRRKTFFVGRSDSRAVICSALIAGAFLNVRYPILPLLPASERQEREEGIFPHGKRVRSVHPSLALPRDFDLSPYFQIVKFNQVEEGPLDYRALDWEAPVRDVSPA